MNSLILQSDVGRLIIRSPIASDQAAPNSLLVIEMSSDKSVVEFADGSTQRCPTKMIASLDFNACVALWKTIRELAPPPVPPVSVPVKKNLFQRFIAWLNQDVW